MIGLINFDTKCAGTRSAGNPHAACDVAGAGNGITNIPSRARRGKPRIRTRAFLKATAPRPYGRQSSSQSRASVSERKLSCLTGDPRRSRNTSCMRPRPKSIPAENTKAVLPVLRLCDLSVPKKPNHRSIWAGDPLGDPRSGSRAVADGMGIGARVPESASRSRCNSFRVRSSRPTDRGT